MPFLNRGAILSLLESRQTARRLRHSLAVEQMAVRLAAAHGEDWYPAGFAGLLHDVCRCDNMAWQLEYMSKNGVEPDSEWMLNPNLWHGPCGAAFIRRELGIRDKDILRAVRYHTTGRQGMTGFEKVVFLADKVGEDRSYDGVEELRAAAFRSLDEAMLLCMKRTLAHTIDKTGLPLVREAYLAYNELATDYHSASNKEPDAQAYQGRKIK